MKKNKLTLDELKVSSFTTSVDKAKGGRVDDQAIILPPILLTYGRECLTLGCITANIECQTECIVCSSSGNNSEIICYA